MKNKNACHICGNHVESFKINLHAVKPPMVEGDCAINLALLCEDCDRKIKFVAIENNYTRTTKHYFVHECMIRGKSYLDRKYKEVKEG